MDLGKPKADASSNKPLNQKLTDTGLAKQRMHELRGREPGLSPMHAGKQTAGRHRRETSPLGTAKTSQGSSDESGIHPLIFTFVPSVGKLPSHGQVAKASKCLVQKAKEPKRVCNQADKENIFSERWTLEKGICRESGRQVNKEVLNKRKQEDMHQNDVFQAEFVFVIDSDDDEEETIPMNKASQRYPGADKVWFKQHDALQMSSNTEPRNINGHKVNHSTPQLSKSSHQEVVSSYSAATQNSSTAPAVKVASTSNQRVGNAVENRNKIPSPRDSLRKFPSTICSPTRSAPTYLKSTGSVQSSFIEQQTSVQDMNTSSTSVKPKSTQLPTIPIPKSVFKKYDASSEESKEFSPTLLHTFSDLKKHQQLSRSLSPELSLRSRTLSPIPSRIITHTLCPHPKSLQSPMYGSSSTLGSNDELCRSMSPRRTLTKSGMSTSLPSRLSFLTAILKSGTSRERRSATPIPHLSNFSPKSHRSSAHSPCQMSTAFSSSLSTANPGHFKPTITVYNKKKSRTLPLSLELKVASPAYHAPSRSPVTQQRTPDPYLISPKPFTKASPSKEKVVSPVLQQRLPSPTASFPTSTSPALSPLNVKPPIRKELKQPFKKDEEPGKLQRDRTPSPSVLTSSPSNQRIVTSSPLKQFPSPTYTISRVVSTPMPANQFSVASSTPVSISPQPPYSRFNSGTPLPLSHNIYSRSPQPDSFPPSPTPRAQSKSLQLGESSTPGSTPCLTTVPIQYSPYSTLSSSSELLSSHALSCSPDSDDNTKHYKITSRYKAFAAIPTNTLLMEQKALNEPTKTLQDGEEIVLETHSELCSPAQIRQQTEEVCAAIDEAIHEPPQPAHRDPSPAPARGYFEADVKKMSTSMPRAAGRETKYASLSSPITIPTMEAQRTKPGVIRPLLMKPTIIMKREEGYFVNPLP